MRVTMEANQTHMTISHDGHIGVELRDGLSACRWLNMHVAEAGVLSARCDIAIWEDQNPALFREIAERFGIDIEEKPAMEGERTG